MRRRNFVAGAGAGALGAWLLRATPGSAESTKPENAERAQPALAELGSWVTSVGGTLSGCVIDLQTKQRIAAFEPTRFQNPASNMKLVTAAVALDLLGPSYRFSTALYGVERAGVVSDLVLRGSGDPSLATEDLWRLARALARRGVTRVERVQVDHGYFDEQFVPPRFEQQPREWAAFRAPVSAVAIERNTVTLNVLATRSGEAARLWSFPDGIISLEGTVATKARGSGQDVKLSVEARPQGLVARVGGHVAEGLPELRFERRLDDPRRVPGLALAELLRGLRVEVASSVSLGGTSVKEQLTVHHSAPLGTLLEELGKNSDNFYAEMLFKVLGAEGRGAPGSSENGAAVVTEWLARNGLGSPEAVIVNGSGLFDANRLSADLIARLLVRVHGDARLQPEFEAHLAVGGVDGTLRSRFRKLRESRSVRAKTGTLAQANALSGYVLGTGAPLAFSLLVNGVRGSHPDVRKRMDEFVELLVTQRKK